MHRVPDRDGLAHAFSCGEKQSGRPTKNKTPKSRSISEAPGYLYPFDHYVIEFSFAVIDKSQKTLYPKLWCELEDPRFVNAAPRQLMSHGDKAVAVPNSLAVVLDRPMYQKIFLGLSMLMGLGCVVWSLYKITYTSITAMESLSLLAFDLTVLLAVPALRGVFVPSNLQFAPLFDFFVVLIWTAGLLTLVVNIVRHDIMIRIRQRASADGQANRRLYVASDNDNENELTGRIPRRVAS